jgi:hypothetical protein
VIVPGPIVADIRGKCGGNTFSRNQGGLYVKANPVWEQPASEYRDATQAVIRDLTPFWSAALTAAQRTAWQNYATANPRPNRWGSRTLHNGYTFWFRHNAYHYREFTEHIFPDPPTIPPPGPVDHTATRFGTTQNWKIIIRSQPIPPLQTELRIYYFDQLPTPPGRSGARGPWRYMGSSLINTTPLPQTLAKPAAFPFTTAQHRAIKIIAQWLPSGALSMLQSTQITT